MKKKTYNISYSTRGSYSTEIEATTPEEANEIFTSLDFRTKNEIYDIDEYFIHDEEGNEVYEGVCY